MRKVIKRLVSILLAVVMVTGLIPFSGAKTAEAAANTRKIFMDMAASSTWAGASSYAVKYGTSGDQYGDSNPIVTMSHVEGTIYMADIPSDAVRVQFAAVESDGGWRCYSSWTDGWSDTNNLCVISASANNGEYVVDHWHHYDYVDPNPTVTPDPSQDCELRYVDVKLYDYLSDEEIAQGWNNFPYDTVSRTSRTPFTKLFETIAEKAKTQGWRRALYTGNFWMDAGAADGAYPMWDYVKDHSGLPRDVSDDVLDAVFNQYVNNNVGLDDLNQVVQGLVKNELKDGDLMAESAPEGYKVSHFDDEFLNNNNNPKLAEIFRTKFPMVVRKTAAGNNLYSFDSTDGKDNVYYDESSNKMIYGAGAENGILDAASNYGGDSDAYGFFPFDKPKSAGGSGYANNFGYGARFDINFNLPSDGMKNGEPITFSFSGDDDLWVFVDGKLILDMGGIHGRATGNINFATGISTIDRTPTVVDPQSGARSDGNTVYDFSSLINKNDPNAVHHMTIFYMERGLVASNLHIEYTFDPLPSGLSLSEEVDPADVNDGLKEIIKSKDCFDFTLSENPSVGQEYNYVKDKDGNEENVSTTDHKVIGLSNDTYAKEFEYKDGTGLKAGTEFKIDQDADPRYSARWIVTDYATGQTVVEGSNTSAEFSLGEKSEDELAAVSYHVKFINKAKVGEVSARKVWSGGNPPADTEFVFKAEVDLDGDGTAYGYAPYKLTYTSSESSRNGVTETDGTFKIKVNETVTFAGIPVGAKVKVTETTTEGTTWVIADSTKSSVESGAVSENSSETLTIVNKAKEISLSKVIYAETGKSTNYTVKENGTAVNVTEITPSEADLNAGVKASCGADGNVTLTVPEADKKYDIAYKGIKEGVNVVGTITVYSYKATDKIYVFDYGLKSDLTKTNDDQDGLFQDGVFFNKEAQNTTDYKTSATLDTISDNGATPQTDITADPNGVTIKADGSAAGAVMFEPKGFMSQVENYNYTAKIAKENTVFDASDPETGTVVNGTIKVMPASVVYYEDNFNSGAQTDDSSMKIVYTGNSTTAGTSLDLSQSNGQTEQYGHDDAYNTAENQQDSGGSSTMLTANGYNTKAIFTFTGTGFDIIARTTTETAGIIYTIEKQNQDGSRSLARMGAVDTLYINGALYQLPVIHEDLEYGTYRVTLGIKQTGNVLTTTDENGNIINTVNTTKKVVYLDGIRIYNPLGESGDENYITNEQDVTVSEVPGLIVGDGTVTETGIVEKEEDGTTTIINSQVISGAKAVIASYDSDDHTLSSLGTTQVEVSTDTSSGNSESVLTYLNAGPNNELYLDETAALAFVVKADAPVNTLQIEAKLVDTQSSEKSVKSDGLALRVLGNKNGTVEEKTIDTIQSSTAMYYRIPVEDCISLDDGYYLVVLLGNSDSENGGTHALSFSNLKYKNYTVESRVFCKLLSACQ